MHRCSELQGVVSDEYADDGSRQESSHSADSRRIRVTSRVDILPAVRAGRHWQDNVASRTKMTGTAKAVTTFDAMSW